eukprot:3647032-Rhodomonas_salina.1
MPLISPHASQRVAPRYHSPPTPTGTVTGKARATAGGARVTRARIRVTWASRLNLKEGGRREGELALHQLR